MRHSSVVSTLAVIGSLAGGVVHAQDSIRVLPQSAHAGNEAAPARKSPAGAAVLGLVLPGAGHWYAGEPGRGFVIAAVYWSGVAVVAGGRTDTVGHIGGAALIGALGASVIDGVLAVGRHNARIGVTPERGGRGTPGNLRVHLTMRW